MPRPNNKFDLNNVANFNFKKLFNIVNNITPIQLSTEFNFTDCIKMKEAHWQRDKKLRDILTHLYEWHMLVINWVNSNIAGENKSFLPENYNWKNYGDMNIEFFKKHQETSLDMATELVNNSHTTIMELINKFSDEELFIKKHFNWTGTSSLGSYFVSSTASHYDWAIKKLNAHIKILNSK